MKDKLWDKHPPDAEKRLQASEGLKEYWRWKKGRPTNFNSLKEMIKDADRQINQILEKGMQIIFIECEKCTEWKEIGGWCGWCKNKEYIKDNEAISAPATNSR